MAGALTAAIAAAFSGVTADPYFEYTTLLLPGSGTNGAQNNTFLDGSTNNFTITRNGNTTQGTFSPFSQTGWGNYFDGSGDSLTIPSGSSISGTGNFTVEFWIYPTTFASGYQVPYINETSGGFAVLLNSTGTLSYGRALVAVDGTTTGTVTFNQWNHVAFVRNGTGSNQFICYINGSSAGSFTNSTNYSSGIVRLGTDAGGTSFPFLGYLSNVRNVTVAVYTGAFTPPTSPLAATQSAGTNISAITGTQTSLLTCQSNRFIDNSTNNFTITRNGDTRVVAFSPFNPTASWSAATNGGSGYFDGSGDYLSIANNSAFDFGSGDFSIEAWIYVPNVSGAKAIITKDDAARSWIFLLNNADAVFAIPASTTSTLTNAVQANTWVHLYFGRSGNTMYKAVNGSVSSDAWTTTIPTTSTAVEIGRQGGYGNPFTGYISGLRVLKGSAAYTSNFTPSVPPTAITNTVLLTNFTNAGVYDATSKNDLETVGDAQISNTTAKWGSTSIKFDGTGDWLDALASNQLFNLSSGDWTIEAWIYRNASGATHTILNLFNASANNSGLTFYVNASNQLVTDNGTVAALAAGTVASGQWVHVAIVRSGGTTTGYVDGTSVGTTTQAPAASQYARIGALASGFNLFNGYTQDLRITKGYARYVTGTGANAGKMVFNGTNNLALPTAAFPTL